MSRVTLPTVLAATWSDGLFVLDGASCRHELAGKPVRSLTPDGRGGALAIVDDHELSRRTADGGWSTVATHSAELASCVAVDGAIYVGTDDARVLRVDSGGDLQELEGFDRVPGRDTWYAGTAVVDGQVVGPPLGVRSMASTRDGGVLLVNVHVGGIARSIDEGASWQPTIDVDSDVHEVRVHPSHPDIAAAAAAVGLCFSRDGGRTWTIEQEGLHATYCSAVAFAGDDLLVAAAPHHFAPEGALYRRRVDSSGRLERVTGGLPEWLEGIADTGCVAAEGSAVAVVDRGGSLHASEDGGRTWTRAAGDLVGTSSVLLV